MESRIALLSGPKQVGKITLSNVDGDVISMIEVKTSDDTPSRSLAHFARFLPNTRKLQLVLNLKREKT